MKLSFVRQASVEKHIELLPKVSDELIVTVQSIRSPGALADFIASNFLYKYEDKQEILEEYDPLKRLEKVCVMLQSEDEILRTEYDIHGKVKARIEGLQQ